MGLEVKVRLKNSRQMPIKFTVGADESTTVYFRNNIGVIAPAFSLNGKSVGGDVVGDSILHLPCFQTNSEKLLHRAEINLTDRVVEITAV